METTYRKRKIDYKKLNASKKFCNTDVIAEVAEEFDIHTDLVKKVGEAQSKHLAKTIKSGGMDTIIFVYLGKFKVNPYQVQKMMSKSMKS